ncbi:MAG TPA: hypothetical protein VKZ18_28805 [Polyangia bacterium]|nr:hypothetical protein [Polyangia bacterium]
MDDLLSPVSDRRRLDLEHLKVLSVFHYVAVGLAGVGLLGLYGHYKLFSTMLTNPAMWQANPGVTPPPAEVFAPLVWMYAVGAVIVAGYGALNLLAARSLRAHRSRMFTFGVAIANCFWFPLGTALGVFTIIVLARESVRALYETRPAAARE